MDLDCTETHVKFVIEGTEGPSKDGDSTEIRMVNLFFGISDSLFD